ncbi:MAG: hypothetical protein ACI4IT_01160 [Oscillospiraceae bacterium]
MKRMIAALLVLTVLTACSNSVLDNNLGTESESPLEGSSQTFEENENESISEEPYEPVITSAPIEPVDGYIEAEMNSMLFGEIMSYENFGGRGIHVSFAAFEDWNYKGYYFDGKLYFIEWSRNDSDTAVSYLYVYDNKDGNYQQIYDGSYRNCFDEYIKPVEGGFFSEGYCFSSYPSEKLSEDDPEAQTRYERQYLLTFGEYVAYVQVAVRLDENGVPYETDETQCENFISSLNIF